MHMRKTGYVMKKNTSKIITVLLSTSFILSTLAGCGNSTEEKMTDMDFTVAEDTVAGELPETESAVMDHQESKETDGQSSETDEKVTAVQEEDDMTDTQRNSLNMLNFLTVLTQEINDSKGSRLYVENAYSALINNTYPNAVDSRTQAQLTNILDTLEGYRMVDVKRERLEYIYEQNRAQAMRHAIPNPMSVLNVVQSGNLLKAAVSVVYMAVDSYSSYSSYTAQTDLKYLQDGWELDDEEAEELHNSRKQAFTYMLSMVRENALEGDFVLNEDSVQEFVTWKNNTNDVRRISWLEANQETYKEFGTYWLVLAESYYGQGEYEKCLEAVGKYEKVTSRIFREDYDYAKILPMAIVSAKEIYEKEQYAELVEKYTELLLNNAGNSDWTLRYFAAEVYLDLYGQTHDTVYAQKAYNIAYNNVNDLIDEQKELNAAYLADVTKAKIPEGATKREKKEIKEYNKALKAERKTELPPISEALYLNCDLLFALADELHIDETEKRKIDSILHENGESIFLMEEIDKRFWFENTASIEAKDIEAKFKGDTFIIPAAYVSANSVMKATVDDSGNKTVIDDWKVKKVTRKKNADYMDFMAAFTSDTADDMKFEDGMTVTIEVTPSSEDTDEVLVFTYNANVVKKFLVFHTISFERTDQ